MLWLSRKRRASLFDAERLKRAIEDAERQTSGEIMVAVAPVFLGRVERAARRAFERLGVSRTRDRNGILFFIVPGRRAFVVLGDEGIHSKVGPAFWESVIASVSTRFRSGDMTAGIVAGIAEVGRQLAVHFPPDAAGARNELPDEPDIR